MGGTLRIHTSNRLELLLDALADHIARAPLPPLVTETIIVPGQGMARWVTLGLARRHGVAATLALPFPGAFLQGLCVRGERDRAFERGALCLRLFRLLADERLHADLGAAALYCRDDRDQHKRLQLAQRLAQCFDDYQLYRDDILLGFERGEAPALPHARWQMRLWQELLREGGAGPDTAMAAPEGPDRPAKGRSAHRPGQRLLFAGDTAAAAAAAEPAAASAHRLEHVRRLLADPDAARKVLPPRLSVFGASTLPPAFLDLLLRIAEHIEVTLYAPKPTAEYYGDVRRDRSGEPPRAGSGHPLLAAWGGQSRDFFDMLLDRDAVETPLSFPDPGSRCALHALQSDLLNLRVRHSGGDAPPLPLDPDDQSLAVHSAHGPLREMEILRDQILHAFGQDATLTPADVMVLVPNVQDYAPYVHAVFRPVQRLLPFHIADRSPAADLPLPATFLRLCALARSRFTAPEMLLLLEEPALARRFDIARPDLLALRTWVLRTRIRWGLDGVQRQQDLGLPAYDDNTWRHGLDRLVLGLATGPRDATVLGLLPAADGTSSRMLLLGRFLQFVDGIGAACRALGRPHTLSAWADLIDDLTARLFRPQDDTERQGALYLQAAARRLRELHDLTNVREELSPGAFTLWLEQELLAQGESRGFLSGSITFAALRPMRAVPMRMLAVCGLGDGAFPRRAPRHTFDLMLHDRRPGDRSVRDDDRQLFLDAVLAARDRLVLTYVGRSSKDNSECAPSPLLSELLEHLDRTFTPPAGHASARDWILVDHPLQAFSPRYGGEDKRLFTYGTASAPAAVAATARAPARARSQPGHRDVIELVDLLDFWRHPVRWYCRRILDVRFPRDDDRDDDAEPFSMHSLDRYVAVDQSVRARLLGRDDMLHGDALLQTGMLPPGPLGRLDRADLALEAGRFFARVVHERGTGVSPVAVVGNDYIVQGELADLRDDAMVLWRSAVIKAKDRLRAFALHVVQCAAVEQGASLPGLTLLIGIDGVARAPSCSPALDHLDRLVAGFRSGQEAPLPFFEKASPAFVAACEKGSDKGAALDAARRIYQPARYDSGAWLHDLPDPCLELCFGDSDPLAAPAFATWASEIYQPAHAFFGTLEQHA